MTSKKSHNPSQILEAVAEAAAWCEQHWDQCEPQKSLRSSVLSPELFNQDRHDCVSSVLWKRKQVILQQNMKVGSILSAGQLLAYEPDRNLFDGLGQSESMGYLDFYDCPPWDTWAGVITANKANFLICWVPISAVELVNNGSDVICNDCIRWVSDIEESWASDIKNA